MIYKSPRINAKFVKLILIHIFVDFDAKDIVISVSVLVYKPYRILIIRQRTLVFVQMAM